MAACVLHRIVFPRTKVFQVTTESKREGIQTMLAMAAATLGTYTIDDLIKLLTAAFLALQIAHRVWLWRRDARVAAAAPQDQPDNASSSHD